MRYPNYTDYRAMYQKYINRKNLFEIIDLAGEYKDKFFLDLCCGDGAASREASLRGAKECTMVDQEKSMLAKDLLHLHIKGDDIMDFFDYSIEQFFIYINSHEEFKEITFDIVFCRQGINYWYTPKLISCVNDIMNDGGVFIFNTFNKKPSRRATVKEYNIDSVNFTEVSYLVSDCIVHHVQIAEGYPPHLTQFKWISEKEFKVGIEKYFDYEIRRRDNTDIYICRKK